MVMIKNRLCCWKIARVKFAEELGTMSKNRLRWTTLVRGPVWGSHSLTLLISCMHLFQILVETFKLNSYVTVSKIFDRFLPLNYQANN